MEGEDWSKIVLSFDGKKGCGLSFVARIFRLKSFVWRSRRKQGYDWFSPGIIQFGRQAGGPKHNRHEEEIIRGKSFKKGSKLSKLPG